MDQPCGKEFWINFPVQGKQIGGFGTSLCFLWEWQEQRLPQAVHSQDKAPESPKLNVVTP